MAEWYNVGTVTWTNNNDIINGTGVAWLTNKVRAGDAIRRPDNVFVEIAEVIDNDSLRLRSVYEGPTLAAQAYTILPTASRSIDSLDYALELLDSFGETRDTYGSGLAPDGTVASPSYSFFQDRDTGFRRVAANSFSVVNGGVDSVYFGADNNTIFGGSTTPVYAASNRTTVQLDGVEGALLAFRTGNANRCYVFASDEEVAMEIEPSCALRLNTFGNKAITLSTSNTPRWVLEGSGTYRPATDNTLPIGAAGNRVSGIFLGTSPTVTSDERDKEWRSALSEDELAVARAIADELGIFQYHDAIAIKGNDGARLHYGPRAQRVFQLFEDHGLDWRRYAWCCHDQWDAIVQPEMVEVSIQRTRKVSVPTSLVDPATGNPVMAEVDEPYIAVEKHRTGRLITVREAGDRYGIRYEQMTLWLTAVLAHDAKQREERIDWLSEQNSLMAATLAAVETRIAALEQTP